MITKLENVSKSYIKNQIALKNFSLEIEEEEFFCLVGPSGGGKSTVLKLISGIEKPSHGTVQKNGDISMVFQSGALLPWLSVRENAEFGLKMVGEKEKKRKEVSSQFLEMVGLENFENKFPRELSGGQRQRVGIARALSMSPQILLLDEPFSALDPVTTDELHKDLLKIWQAQNLTIIMVSHYLEEAVFLADRIAVISSGELKGLINVGLKRPRDEDSEEFLHHVKSLKQTLER